MAKRLIFIVEENKLKEKEIEFKYYTGFALTQKQKSIFSLHNEIKKIFNGISDAGFICLRYNFYKKLCGFQKP